MLRKHTAATHDVLGALVPPRDVGANDFGEDEESEAGVCYTQCATHIV